MGYTKKISISCQNCQFNNRSECMISRRINGKWDCLTIKKAKELFPFGCIEWKIDVEAYLKNYLMIEEEIM